MTTAFGVRKMWPGALATGTSAMHSSYMTTAFGVRKMWSCAHLKTLHSMSGWKFHFFGFQIPRVSPLVRKCPLVSTGEFRYG